MREDTCSNVNRNLERAKPGIDSKHQCFVQVQRLTSRWSSLSDTAATSAYTVSLAREHLVHSQVKDGSGIP